MGALIGTAAIGAVASVGAGAIAANEAEKGRDAQQSAIDTNRALIDSVEVPAIEKMKIILENPQLMGELSPEMLQEIHQEASALEGLKADENLVNSQQNALSDLEEIAEGGYTDADMARNRQIDREINQSAEARRKSILNSMAQRGTLGSGIELATQLQANQEANQRQAEESDRLKIQAQQNAMQARLQAASLAGQMRNSGFNENRTVAQARDNINRFNTQNSQSVQSANVLARNNAQAKNLAAAQNIADAATNNRNEAERYNRALVQDDYMNRLNRARSAAGLNTSAANITAAGAADRARNIGAIGGAIANTAGIIGGQLETNKTQENKVDRSDSYAMNYDPDKYGNLA